MNKKSILIILTTTAILLFAGCSSAPAAVQPNHSVTENNSQPESRQIETTKELASAAPTCAQPTPELVSHCQKMEEDILASTVRLELFRWLDADGRQGEYIAGGNSHATIKDGRYLVTHNHFGDILTALRNQGVPGEYIRLALYKTNGELILSNIPLTDLTVIVEDPQTIVLAFKDEGKLGFFEIRGLPSADFAAWHNLPLQSGTEVAQIDWDGQTSHVKWTTIEQISTDNETPQLTLTSYVNQGASGGGIFWNGIHIANNWFRTREQNQATGEVLLQFTAAALNSMEVTAVAATSQYAAQTTAELNTLPPSQIPANEELLSTY